MNIEPTTRSKCGLTRIRQQHFPGYGSAESWKFAVLYRRFTLETRSTECERDLGLIESRLRRKWKRKTAEELDALVAGKEPEWPACSVCGSDDDERAGNATTSWCAKCYAKLKQREKKARLAAHYCAHYNCECFAQGPLHCACEPDSHGCYCRACGAALYPAIDLYWWKYGVERVRLGKMTHIAVSPHGRPGYYIQVGSRIRLVATDESSVMLRINRITPDGFDVSVTGEQAPEHWPLNHYVLGNVQRAEQFQQLRAS